LAPFFKEGGEIFTFFEKGKKSKKEAKISPSSLKEVANLLAPRKFGGTPVAGGSVYS
jgi:hypothetical protein